MRLSQVAIDRITDHIEALEAMAEDEEDRQLAVDLRTLLDSFFSNLQGG